MLYSLCAVSPRVLLHKFLLSYSLVFQRAQPHPDLLRHQLRARAAPPGLPRPQAPDWACGLLQLAAASDLQLWSQGPGPRLRLPAELLRVGAGGLRERLRVPSGPCPLPQPRHWHRPGSLQTRPRLPRPPDPRVPVWWTVCRIRPWSAAGHHGLPQLPAARPRLLWLPGPGARLPRRLLLLPGDGPGPRIPARPAVPGLHQRQPRLLRHPQPG